VTVLDAMGDPNLLGAAFPASETWAAWRALLASVFALPMGEVEAALYREHTGRQSLPASPAREAWLVVGRRGGKSRVAATVAVYLAAFRDYRNILAPGERATLPLIACDRRQARTLVRYVTGLLDASLMLSALVANRTAESVELTNGVTIEVHTASFRSIRGYTVVAAVLDEVAFWRSDDSANPDREIVNALRPAMATVPGALLLAISSPYARRGCLWEAYRQHHGRDGDPVLIWRASTRDMNPTVHEHVVEQALAEDEAAARAEYLAEFRRDIETFIAREAMEACIIRGRHELPPVPDVFYTGFTDPSGGSSDSFTLAIAHCEERDGRVVVVLDAVREVRPPFSPEAVVAEFAALAKSYRVPWVTGDRYAGVWPRERFREHGVGYAVAKMPKNDIYATMLPLLNSRRIELLDHPRLAAQLTNLERRTSWGGRDSIDHPLGMHDDLSNAAAGALTFAARRGVAFGGGDIVRREVHRRAIVMRRDIVRG
jgi:hypothetical protein